MWWEYFESFRDDFVKINIDRVSRSRLMKEYEEEEEEVKDEKLTDNSTNYRWQFSHKLTLGYF